MIERSYFYKHKNGINFRKITSNDLEVLRDLKDESWFGTVNTVCLNMDDQHKWYEKVSNDKSCLYLIANSLHNPDSDAGLYGFTDFNPINRTCSYTHSIFQDFRGKGYGLTTLEAGIDLTFEIFNMRRIDTWILENNQAELKVATKVGFQIEGTARKAVYKCGQYLNCYYLGLLREDWGNSARVKAYNGVCNKSYLPKDGTSATTSK